MGAIRSGFGILDALELREIIAKKKKEKWIQKSVKKPGAFTDYCKGKGFEGVTQECIQEGKQSPNKKVKQRAELAETLKEMH